MKPLSESTLSAIFRRKGGVGVRTRLFDEMDHSEQSRLMSEFNVSTGECPVLGIAEAGGFSLVLTTRNLLWREGNERKCVPLSSVSWQHPIRTGEKRSWSQMRIETFDGSEFVVSAEPGRPYFGFWNVLLYIARRNLKLRSAETGLTDGPTETNPGDIRDVF